MKKWLVVLLIFLFLGTATPQSADAATTGPTYIDGILIVNKTYSLPSTYAPGESKTARAAFDQMAAAAKKDGIGMYAFSTYRSYSRQKELYDNYVKKYGQKEADRFSAKPGHSEHQTGLAFDISQSGASDVYAESAASRWLAKNAYKYGFILRYPQNKEHITGYMYEPWHYRYLGVKTATAVYSSGKTLEEYLGVYPVKPPVPPGIYIDTPQTHWAYKDIVYLSDQKIITGFKDGSFQPNKKTTRTEAAIMLVKALNLPLETGSLSYPDVSDDHWAKPYIYTATKAGLFVGNANGNFRPAAGITRAEVAAVLSRAYGLQHTDQPLPFGDVSDNYWAYEDIQKVYENKLASGYEDGTFQPTTLATRAHFAAFLSRTMQQAN